MDMEVIGPKDTCRKEGGSVVRDLEKNHMAQHVLGGLEKQQFLAEKCYTGVKAVPPSSLPNPFSRKSCVVFS